MATVLEIVKEYLAAKRFGGLVSEHGDCACLVDDLAPCGAIQGDCRAGLRTDCACGEGCEFHIVATEG